MKRCLGMLRLTLPVSKTAIEAWRVDYNNVRPHSCLAGRTPNQFAARAERSDVDDGK